MPTTPEFSLVLERLRDLEQAVSMSNLYHLSDLAGADLAALERTWAELPAERRQNILHDLNEIGEANFEVSFEAVFRLGLDDEDPEVRATAIRALWESEDPTLIAPLIDFLATDPDEHVRAAAASALGRFVYLGEVEELPAQQARRVEDALLAVIGGPDALEVKRRALEAVAYAARPEIAPLIQAAYTSPEPLMRISAVFAMGRTAEAQWAPQVLAELKSAEPEMRFEAARAAGELELQQAGPDLARLTADKDTQVKEAAIWSLGQVGGDFAQKTLERLLKRATDEDERDFIEEAIENLAFSDEVRAFALSDDDDEAGFSLPGLIDIGADELDLDDDDDDALEDDFDDLDEDDEA
jgi:HEAT repeat protein